MNAPATQSQQHPVVSFKRSLDAVIEKKELALPTNVSTEAFKNAAIVAVQDNPQILLCDQQSVFKSIRTLAAAGLVPDGREAALVPFNTRVDGQYVKKCQAMPMVFGLVKMARRSGDVADIRAHIVYQNEVDKGRFKYVVGDEEKLEHDPILFGDKGEAVGAYAIARLKDGSLIREFMDATDIDRIRRSGASQRVKGGKVSDTPIGIWKDHAGEMWKKTVIRRLCKRLDLSAEDMRRMMVDQDQAAAIKDVTPQEEQTPNLAQKLAGSPAPEEDPNTLDGEILPADEEAAPVEQESQEGGGTPERSFEYDEGATAFRQGKGASDCPYEDDDQQRTDWLAGWNDAYNEADQEGGEE
ncbi:Rmf/CrpP family protein [Tritonibacter mobilis]|uniref:ribosome modulation factor n=1 Tax=Tritonibacter mobilis TaxID=379347 RepID=UPI000806CB61|nr:Rmf/CrpP family protein [Tritonibacter mobilis]